MANFLKSKEVKELKKYLKKEKKVSLAFLFGSFAKGREMRESDVDIGIYLKDKKKEDEIWHEISKIIQKEVDLVILNDAPASLISVIFQTGIPLVVKDKKLYWELYLEKSSEAEDFSYFLEDFWRIYQKSRSLIPGEKNRLLERFYFIDSELKEIDKFKKITFQQ